MSKLNINPVDYKWTLIDRVEELVDFAEVMGPAYSKAIANYVSKFPRKNGVPLPKLMALSKAYFDAKEKGVSLSSEQLQDASGIHYVHANRLIKEMGLEPMYGLIPRLPHWKKRAFFWSFDHPAVPFNVSTLANLVGMKQSTAAKEVKSVENKKGKKRKIFPPFIRQFNDEDKEKITYSGLAEIYECIDEGFTSLDDIVEISGKTKRYVEYAIEKRDEFEPVLISGIKIMLHDDNYSKPYIESNRDHDLVMKIWGEFNVGSTPRTRTQLHSRLVSSGEKVSYDRLKKVIRNNPFFPNQGFRSVSSTNEKRKATLLDLFDKGIHSYYELSRLSGLSRFTVIGYLNQSGVTVKRKLTEFEEEALFKARELDMDAASVAYFLDVPVHLARRRLKGRIKKRGDWAIARFVKPKTEVLDYKTASEVYRLQDKGLSKIEIADNLGRSERLVNHAIENKWEISSKIIEGLHLMYDDGEIVIPYIINGFPFKMTPVVQSLISQGRPFDVISLADKIGCQRERIVTEDYIEKFLHNRGLYETWSAQAKKFAERI